MVATLDENNQSRSWWYNQLNLSDDWNSMPLAERTILSKKLQRALLDLTQLNMTQKEMDDLLIKFDQSTVWDAILALDNLAGKEGKTRWELLAYLKKTADGMWKAQHPSRQITWQRKDKEPVNKKERLPADWENVERNDPTKFNKKFCRVCKRKLRVNNTTGVCSKCQSHGNGKDDSEH